MSKEEKSESNAAKRKFDYSFSSSDDLVDSQAAAEESSSFEESTQLKESLLNGKSGAESKKYRQNDSDSDF